MHRLLVRFEHANEGAIENRLANNFLARDIADRSEVRWPREVAARDRVQTRHRTERQGMSYRIGLRRRCFATSSNEKVRSISRAGYKKIPRMCNGRETEA